MTNRISIKARLFGGFGILVLIGLLLPAYAVLQVNGIMNTVREMAALSEGNSRIFEVSVHLQAIRRAILQYQYDGNVEALKETRERERSTIDLMKASMMTARSEEHLKSEQELLVKLEKLRTDRERLAVAVQKMRQAKEELFGIDKQLDGYLAMAEAAVQSRPDEVLATRTITLKMKVAALQVATWRYMDTLGNEEMRIYQEVLSEANQAYDLVRIGKLPIELESLLEPLHATMQKHAEIFDKASNSLIEGDRIYRSEVLPLTQLIAAKLDDIAATTTKVFSAAKSRTERTISSTIYIQALLGVLALVLGGLFAVIIARSIVRPIDGIRVAMTALASGDSEVAIPGRDNRDEIGTMARAVEVFKANAFAKNRLEAEVRARTLSEKEEAEQKLAEERAFQSELSKLVEAASSGDFSRRIDLSGKSGLTAKLGSGVNTWADNISAAFGQVREVMSALANGDVTRRMEGEYEGDLAQLRNEINRMADGISSVVGRIVGAAATVQGATHEIGSGVTDLAERTEQQASALEETAASMEQMSATVRQNALNAQEANRAATSTRDLAIGGGEIAGRAVAAMSRIEDSSRQITEIVDLIEEIAFQTNILALNAAVEAARAGDAGRGFAVVANEVRALSQRSSQALKDIKTQIASSDASVKAGVDLVKQAGISLGEIVESVKRVAGLVAEIAAASQEQSTGIEQVSRAIGSMDQMTQQNASLVEETNSALNSAQTQVGELQSAVSFFKTAEQPGLVNREPRTRNQVLVQQGMLARQFTPGQMGVASGKAINFEGF
jgi:methyl-accepting chemotaxis protein